MAHHTLRDARRVRLITAMKVCHQQKPYRIKLSAQRVRDLISALTFCIQELPSGDRRHKLGVKLIRKIRLTQ